MSNPNKELIKVIEAKLNAEIVKYHLKYIAGDAKMTFCITAISELVSDYENKTYLKLKGYSERNIRRMLKEGSVDRKTRADKFVVKNRILADVEKQEKLLELAYSIYLNNAKANINLLVDLIQHHAKINHDYIEFAAVPKSTLYNFLWKTFQSAGLPKLHEFFNHYPLYNASLPKRYGAFTDDIKFMDFIIGDDHKADVSNVYDYDEVTNTNVKRQVKIWYWCEAKTMKPLGYICQTEDLTVSDLIESLSEVFLKYGRPNRGVMMDNGLGAAEGMQEFLRKLEIPAHYAAPYEPTAKAMIERTFGLWKNEFDVFHENFVGPDKRKENRLRGKQLSPEETRLTIADYKNKLDTYLGSFFQDRIRNRNISGKQVKISIRDYYNQCYLNYESVSITEREIAFAISKHESRKYKSDIVVKGRYYTTLDSVPLGFTGMPVLCFYRPNNPTYLFVYSAVDFYDRVNNVAIAKGGYVCKMEMVNSIEQPDKHHAKRKANVNRDVNALAKSVGALELMRDPELRKAMTTELTRGGEVVDPKEKREKQIAAGLQLHLTERQVKKAIPKVIENITNGKKYELTQSKNNSVKNQLTIKGEQID